MNLCTHIVQCYTQVCQDIPSYAFPFPQQAQQQMFGANIIIRFLQGVFEHFFSPRRLRQLAGGYIIRTFSATPFHLEGHTPQINPKILQDRSPCAFAVSNQAQKDVFRTDKLMIKSPSFLVSQLHNLPALPREFVKQLGVLMPHSWTLPKSELDSVFFNRRRTEG